MSVAKRVQELERRLGTEDNRTLLRLSFSGCNPEVTGSERVAERPVVAFRTLAGDHWWHLGKGETVEQLWARAKSEVQYTAWGVAVLMECYEAEPEVATGA